VKRPNVKRPNVKLQKVAPRLAKRGPEQLAIEAGEIDAIVDHASHNIILLPAARRALHEAADRTSAAREGARLAPIANRVLAALPRNDYLGLMDGLEPVVLTYGTVLYEPGETIAHVHFPIDCLVSLLATVEGRRAMEVGLVGREGMVGIPLALGVEVSSVRALVQGTGRALRMNAARFKTAIKQCPPLRDALHRHACVMLAQARQTVACNQFHLVEARLARWLLMTSDRTPSEEFFLTQEFLADMLGVLRAAVNRAAGSFRQRDLIRYRRGRVRILDRKGLEAAACRCYTKIEGPEPRATWTATRP
jgi:CRP-like cAMP-binding protein